MSYKSPIEIVREVTDPIINQIQMQEEEQIKKAVYQAVRRIGVTVDEKELLEALRYDRGQYDKGYQDRDDEITRCKECKYRAFKSKTGKIACSITSKYHDPEWFCADGEYWSYDGFTPIEDVINP